MAFDFNFIEKYNTQYCDENFPLTVYPLAADNVLIARTLQGELN